eukprot:11129120-Lingulodinium_polyedra.AAC.1
MCIRDSPRAADYCSMKLVEAQKKHGWDWAPRALVLSAGQRINFMQCYHEIPQPSRLRGHS